VQRSRQFTDFDAAGWIRNNSPKVAKRFHWIPCSIERRNKGQDRYGNLTMPHLIAPLSVRIIWKVANSDMLLNLFAPLV
jgi:hypothetical protein